MLFFIRIVLSIVVNRFLQHERQFQMIQRSVAEGSARRLPSSRLTHFDRVFLSLLQLIHLIIVAFLVHQFVMSASFDDRAAV